MHYRDADDELFALFEANSGQLLQTVGKTKYKNTYRALFGFLVKSNALKTGIFDAVDNNNPYVLRILFRCLCEHYLKFTHVFTRFLDESSDSVGRDFYSYCGASEAWEHAKSLRFSEGLIGKEFLASLDAHVHALFPDTAGMSARQLESKSAEFKYREILRRLSSLKPELISEGTPFLASIVPEYARLSAFVHGGPAADYEMQSFADEEEFERSENRASLAFIIVASVYGITVSTIAHEFEEFSTLAGEMSSILMRYLELEV